jgi:hypothetical protein
LMAAIANENPGQHGSDRGEVTCASAGGGV